MAFWNAPWWVWVIAVVGAVVSTTIYRWYARRSPAYRKGFHPANRSFLVRMYRLHRADEGKSDPRLLHAPLDKFNARN